MSTPRSIDMLQQYLEPRGYIFEEFELGIDKKHFTTITSQGGKSIVMSSDNPLYPFATSSARLIAKDKLKSYEFMERLHITTPRTVYVEKDMSALDSAEQLLAQASSVVVKPSRGAGSVGLTRDVTGQESLKNAVVFAHTISDIAIVQEQFFGEEVRFVLIKGAVKGAVLRQKPFVIGDGSSTVSRLIDVENQKRLAIENTVVQYPQLNEVFVSSELLHSQAVPLSGERIELSKSTMISGGASMYDIIEKIHPSYLEIAEHAGSLVGDGYVAIDMMIKDPSQPADESNYVFLEMNLNPALALFYSCRDGKHFPAIEQYIGPMLEEILH